MTPQDIRERVFEKAMFGGYDMGGVDDFMDDTAAEFEVLQKDNATLKVKMKVLVEKIEEYRGSEDAMRMTLLSAQKLANQIELDARARADKTIADADATAARALETLKNEVLAEQEKLSMAKSSFVRFFTEARSLCNNQLDYLDRVNMQGSATGRESVVDDTVRSIEASVARMPDEPAPQIDITPAMSEQSPRQTITPDDVTRLFSMGGQG